MAEAAQTHTVNGVEYEIDLRSDPLKEKDPTLVAAFELAEEIYAKQKKLRESSGRLATTHAITTYNIMRKINGFGNTFKAIGLLHDVLEDYYRKKEHYEALRQKYPDSIKVPDADLPDYAFREDLLAKLREKNPRRKEKRLRQEAESIYEGVRQLSNDAILLEDKRTWQVGHTSELRIKLRRIKVADQLASVAEDILYSDPRDKGNPAKPEELSPMQNAIVFGMKGLDIARTLSQSKIGLSNDKFFAAYGWAYEKLKEIYDLAQKNNEEGCRQIEEIREPFRDNRLEDKTHIPDKLHKIIDYIVGQAQQPLPPRLFVRTPEFVSHYYCPAWIPLESGLQRITLSHETGKVVGFGICVNPEKDNRDPINQASSTLRNWLESLNNILIATNTSPKRLLSKRTQHKPGRLPNEGEKREDIQHQGVELHKGGVFVRSFRITPIDLEMFLNTAYETQSINADFLESMGMVKEKIQKSLRTK